MNILLSAFACTPHAGSEGGAGWRWAYELSKQHDVVVITDISRRAAIEAELARSPRANLLFVYHRPPGLRRAPLNSWTAQAIYHAWQLSLLPLARRLHRRYRFDLAHHLTYGVFRHPSFLGYLDIPFVFGPVGGGEHAPWALRRSMPAREKVRELIRDVVNLVARWDPTLWFALRRAGLIITRTQDTANALPRGMRVPIVVQHEIGIDMPSVSRNPRAKSASASLKIIFAGRLLGLKGVHLALDALAQCCARGYNAEFYIVGSGPTRPHLQRQIELLNLGSRVKLIERIPRTDLLSLYQTMDCLLFPSLRDAGSNVILEALSCGLPVIGLDLGGTPIFVDATCGLIVQTKGKSEREVIAGIAGALVRLASSPQLRMRLSYGALLRAAELSWEKQIDRILETIDVSLLRNNTKISSPHAHSHRA